MNDTISVDLAEEILERHRERFERLNGVNGVGVGEREGAMYYIISVVDQDSEDELRRLIDDGTLPSVIEKTYRVLVEQCRYQAVGTSLSAGIESLPPDHDPYCDDGLISRVIHAPQRILRRVMQAPAAG